jgi:hypothetical protein
MHTRVVKVTTKKGDMMTLRTIVGSVLAVAILGAGVDLSLAQSKTKKGKGPAPSTISRSNKAPSAYHLFLTPAKDSAKAGTSTVKLAGEALNKAFAKPGYVIDTPAEGAPKESDELAKWLRNKDRTGLKLDITIESLKESEQDGNTRFDAKIKATVFTSPSGWLVMSTTGEAGALSDGMMLDKDLQEAAVEAAVNALVDNVTNYLTKKPVPIDK